ncbi:MAG: hypothetical protein ACOX50_04375 [Patescibacteria group bacterium]
MPAAKELDRSERNSATKKFLGFLSNLEHKKNVGEGKTVAEQISSHLQNLNESEFNRVTNLFLSALNQDEDGFVPSKSVYESLLNFVEVYCVYQLLLTEWRKRQTGSFSAESANTFRKLKGELPPKVKIERAGLNQRQIESVDWDREVHFPHHKFFNDLAEFYSQGGELPYCWLAFLVKKAERIREWRMATQRKQKGLSEEDKRIMNFLISFGTTHEGELLKL